MSDETDYSSLPIEDRLVHKVWKVRLEAYDQITKQFEGSRSSQDECFQRFNSQPQEFKKIITDANVVAQESGIQSLLRYLEYGATPQSVSRLRSANVVTSLCEKGLSSNRVGTKEKSIQCILMFIEITNEIDGILEDILSFLGNRLPKLVSGCVNALAQIVSNFGCQVVPAKLIIPHLSKLFAHADKNVRAETQKLTVELYKWMRDALVNVLYPELKPVQQKDLTKEFEKIEEGRPTQLRFTRKQQEEIERKRIEAEEAAAAAAAASEGGASGEQPAYGDDVEMRDAEDESADFNPYDLVEPTEVLSKFPADFHSRISSAKWKDRKEVLDEVHAILEKTVKLETKDDYSDIMRIFTKCMKDANVQVVQLAANCVEFLSKGLQTNFQRYQNMILAPMLERTKEKKPSVADALNNCLDAIFKGSSLSDVLEETLNGMKHKTPQVKISTINYLQRCLAETKIAPKRVEIDAIMEVGVKLLADSQEPVRQASTEMIGTLMKITGVRELNSSLEKVDENRKAKVMAFYETVQVKAKKTAEAPKQAPRGAGNNSSTTNSIRRPSSIPSTTRPVRSTTGSTATSNIGSGAKKLTLPSAAATTTLKKPRSALNSIPTKRLATSPAKRTDSEVPRNSVGRIGGLTSGPVSRLSNPSRNEDGLSSAEKEELISLREQAQKWKAQELKYKQEFQQRVEEERSQFEEEIAGLQRKNESLLKEYNGSLITLKQRDTQILRLTSDLESSKLRIRDLQQSIEVSNLLNGQQQHQQQEQGQQQTRNHGQGDQLPLKFLHSASNPTNSGIGSNRYSTSYLSDYQGTRLSSSELSSRVKRLSIDPDLRDHNTRQDLASNRFTSPQKISESTNTFENGNKESMDLNNNDDSWKRAAEVTNQLKARIEKMKARSRVNFQ